MVWATEQNGRVAYMARRVLMANVNGGRVDRDYPEWMVWRWPWATEE